MCYIGLVVVFLILWLSHIFSANSLQLDNAISFCTLLILPAFVLSGAVEFMWSYVAKNVDIGRQTYMHPLTFYVIISALYTIALIENGVFTLSVIFTHVLQSNVMTMAYAGKLFASHGKIWKSSRSSRTGFILLSFLPSTMHIFNMVPVYPINCELNILWCLPVIFAAICYAKILFIDHFMDDESNMTHSKKFKVTHSDHLLSTGHLFITTFVVAYYIIQLTNLRYGENGGSMMFASGGRLSKRLNFEFGEINVTEVGDIPSYGKNFSDVYYVNS
jgi:hypothetical protein